ncbi:sialidase family protein [Reinekea marina]|uniref:Exo-alpha-sialidase n=1 Tax=Reinekea marina TaxID=1310421 RepID=A0ABV7WUJ5_9GAMM|nr:sialidase family protein [Reinekea marina]MDN3649295.1 sialidase family protein [Reinekea marina]
MRVDKALQKTSGVQALLALLFIVLVSLSVLSKPIQPSVEFKAPALPDLAVQKTMQSLALPSETKMVHASYIEQLPNNRQLLYWFGGSREGHKDVQIYRAVVQNGEIVEPVSAVLSAPMLSELSGRYIKKLGNPVAKHHNGKLYVWVVSVSVGGWATAKVDMLISEDEGKTFVYGEKLNTSPFFNISNLVRNPPVATSQGFILPAYFELNRLDPLFIHLDTNMRMQHAQTLPMNAIQPILIPNIKDNTAKIFARPIEQKNIQGGLWNPDGSRWEVSGIESLPNDSADSAVVQIGEDKLLMVHNGGNGRGQLYLSISEDGGEHWQIAKTLEDQPGERFAYPSMIIGSDGMIHISYTYKRQHIQYIRATIPALLAEAQ